MTLWRAWTLVHQPSRARDDAERTAAHLLVSGCALTVTALLIAIWLVLLAWAAAS